jgi:cell division protein FtsQ
MISAFSIFGVAVVVALATGGRGAAIAQTIAVGADNTMGRAGFAVHTVHVDGASKMAEADILRAVAVQPGQPILGLNLDHVREAVERVGWVKTAHVLRLMPNTLLISVTEKPRLAVWQHSGQLGVIDAEGQVISEADPAQFSDLPLVVGEGANTSANNVIALLQSRPRLMGMVDALVRVDNRRWDLRLKDASLVQLPADGEDAALIQLDRLDRDQRVLELGFSRIDLRTGDPVVRPKGRDTAAVVATGM